MQVIVLHPKPGYKGNILWQQFFPMRGGKFAANHPFGDNPEMLTFSNTPAMADDKLSKFRQAGYYASCFPEGDGIVFSVIVEKSKQEVEKDITEILGLEIIASEKKF